METTVILTAVFGAITLWFVLGIWKSILELKSLVQKEVTETKTMISGISLRLVNHEKFFEKLGNAVHELVMTLNERFTRPDNYHTMYRTMDGKYTASSLEDLLIKIRRDGAEKEYLSDDEIDTLRRMFEAEAEDDEDEDTDDFSSGDKFPFEK
jgi:hypothetical protein